LKQKYDESLLSFGFNLNLRHSIEVNRDTLFSAHRASEQFLRRMMSLYIASHYKNTPNDLQLMVGRCRLTWFRA